MTRRIWFPRDAWLTADPKVQRLGDRHGGEAVLAFEEMLALAKLEDDEHGWFTTSYSIIARRAFLKSGAVAKRIVATCEDLGLVELDRMGGDDFSARAVNRSRWTDPGAAARKAAQRARDRARDVTGNVTPIQRDNDGTAA